MTELNPPEDRGLMAPTSYKEASADRSAASILRQVFHAIFRELLPTLFWSLRRTGKLGLIGIALLGMSGIFFLSTYSPVATEVAGLSDNLQAAKDALARHAAKAEIRKDSDPRNLMAELPARSELPKILGVILEQADNSAISIDSGKYDIATTRVGAVTRYNLSFPISGTYPAIRSFIDHVLNEVPTISVSELSIERKTIAEEIVTANVRFSLYMRGNR